MEADTSLLEGVILHNGVVDYYQLLGVGDDADITEIKKSYRQLAKIFHPDQMGEKGHKISVLLNEGYNTLTQNDSRRVYDGILQDALEFDEDSDFTGQPVSKWFPTQDIKHAKNADPAERRAVFVDEPTCIGCTNCLWCAEKTFFLEDEHGRSRVKNQWADNEADLKAAITSCPVDCIHWVDKDELPVLEYLMQIKNRDRVNVGVMMGGTGGARFDIFKDAKLFIRNREEKRRIQEMRMKYSKVQAKMRQKAEQQVLNKKEKEEMQGIMGFFQKFYDNLLKSFTLTEQQRFESVYGKDDNKSFGSRIKREYSFERKVDQAANIPPDLALVSDMRENPEFQQMHDMIKDILEQEHLRQKMAEHYTKIRRAEFQNLRSRRF